ncbi:MAG: hypothetical protein HOU81_15475 [Hamadaea sp.]|uniref:hypothetical protein n=1 Tax=Hamadaea sp. TaxID=2024425 RepID=UPI0018201747|nr:hypothetical protein [Hamadaea sp.]NUR72213.1 hypothetical protein [Hamadaea sp.]NUT22106.1 hypothetical protein [Hamadaea sp.]
MRSRGSGSVSVFFSIMALGWVTILVLIIAGGGRVRAYQRADNIAAEAARVAGQAIELPAAVAGDEKRIDPVRARLVALAYLRDAGATGDVTVAEDGQSVRVTATVAYENPSGFPFLGGKFWYATGAATAVLLVG